MKNSNNSQKPKRPKKSRNLKNLLVKEARLPASPLTWIFLLFSGLMLLPGYPILVSALFVCLGIFYSFQTVREYNDILYSVLLPLPKRDTVTGKYAFVCLIQILAFVLMAVLMAVRMTLLAGLPAYVNNALMPANPVFLAFAALIFAAFNVLFLGGFFKNAYSIGRPFVAFLAAAILLVALGETLHHIPAFRMLKSISGTDLIPQFILLAGAILLYIGFTTVSYRKSVQAFEVLDL